MNQAFIYKLSQEIVDEIVDFLSASKAVLSACSLTHRIFLHRCQKHLFSILYFSSDRNKWTTYDKHSPRKDRMRKLLDIFLQSPQITQYVYGLHLDISSWDNEWVSNDLDFTRIMETIKRSGSNITRLKLRGLEFPEKIADARSLERNFLLPFISATLTTLDISHIVDIPMSLIAYSSKLKHLRLHYSASEFFDEYLDKDLIRALPKLETLEFIPPDATISLLIRPDGFVETDEGYIEIVKSAMAHSGVDSPAVADITSLRSFKAFNDPKSMHLTQAVINKAQHSLEKFYLCGDPEAEDFCELTNLITFADVSRLQRLYMDIVMPFSSVVDAIEDLCSVLKTIPTSNPIQAIGLQVFNGQYNRRSVPDSIHPASWRMLDGEIARIAGEKPFRFQLHICHQPAQSSDSESDSDLDGERRDTSRWADEPENIVRLRTCRSLTEREVLLHDMCKSVYKALLLQDMQKVMESPNIIIVPTYSISTPYHYWAPLESHVKNII